MFQNQDLNSGSAPQNEKLSDREIQFISQYRFPLLTFSYLSQTTHSTIQLELSLEEKGCLEGNADPHLHSYQILNTPRTSYQPTITKLKEEEKIYILIQNIPSG